MTDNAKIGTEYITDDRSVLLPVLHHLYLEISDGEGYLEEEEPYEGNPVVANKHGMLVLVRSDQRDAIDLFAELGYSSEGATYFGALDKATESKIRKEWEEFQLARWGELLQEDEDNFYPLPVFVQGKNVNIDPEMILAFDGKLDLSSGVLVFNGIEYNGISATLHVEPNVYHVQVYVDRVDEAYRVLLRFCDSIAPVRIEYGNNQHSTYKFF